MKPFPYEELLPFPEVEMNHEKRYEAKKRANIIQEKEEELPPSASVIKKLLTPNFSNGNIVKLEKDTSNVIPR